LLYEYEPEYEWQATGLNMIPNTSHFKCVTYSGVIADEDRVARGELVCIAQMMHRIFTARGFLNFTTVPVMLPSFVGPNNGRILQAHYDHNKLIVQKSRLFNFQEEQIEAMKVFIRCWCSSAVGNTTSTTA
ncbi:hypothetical protein BJX99DRAFT_227077, partial [Aspergillus californicus]